MALLIIAIVAQLYRLKCLEIPKTNGGQDTMYTRQRKVFAPRGISFTKSVMATTSPTAAELETGANWAIVNDGSGTTINHKAIPIARIVSLG